MRGFSISRLELRQVHGQVVGEPAVPGPEGLGLAVWASCMMPNLSS